MKPLTVQSEVYQREGGIDARSQRRTLGRHRLSPPDLFLRETLQNSWDARAGDGGIRFDVDAWHVTPAQRAVLTDIVFRQGPPGHSPAAFLADNRDIHVLVVTDRGTRGLNGPTRADRVWSPAESNFVALVRNTGRDLARGYAGGTYGFGKAVLFDASMCATVVIFTRTHVGGRPVTRLMAMTVDEPYVDAGRRHTGRHWWGVPSDGAVDPVEGPRAEDIAAALGLGLIPEQDTGTSLMVLAPNLHAETLHDHVTRLAHAATQYAWPHMTSQPTATPNIRFGFTCDARPVPVPDPLTDPRLKHFVAAYRHCLDTLDDPTRKRDAWPWTVSEVRSQRPDRRLGAIAHRDYQYVATGTHDAAPAEVALMRSPRFVVQYMSVRPTPSGQATAGVFIAAPELDEDFAKSEPATHDDWLPENLDLQPHSRNPVKQALDQIRSRFRTWSVQSTATPSSHHTGTVALASRLGRLLDGTVAGTDPRLPSWPTGSGRAGVVAGNGGQPPGTNRSTTDNATQPGGQDHNGPGATSRGVDTEPRTPSSGGRGQVARTRASIGTTTRLVIVDGLPAVEFNAEVTVPAGVDETVVVAVPYVMVDGGRESEPPVGAAQPLVLSWRHAGTGAVTTGPAVTVNTTGQWYITVRQPVDTAVSVRLDLHRTDT